MPDNYFEMDEEERESILLDLPSLFENQAENLSSGQLRILHDILDSNMEPKNEYFKDMLADYNLGDSIIETITDIIEENEIVILM